MGTGREKGGLGGAETQLDRKDLSCHDHERHGCCRRLSNAGVQAPRSRSLLLLLGLGVKKNLCLSLLPSPPSKASSTAGRRVACSSGRWWLACDDEVGEEEEEEERVEIWQCDRKEDTRGV